MTDEEKREVLNILESIGKRSEVIERILSPYAGIGDLEHCIDTLLEDTAEDIQHLIFKFCVKDE